MLMRHVAFLKYQKISLAFQFIIIYYYRNEILLPSNINKRFDPQLYKKNLKND